MISYAQNHEDVLLNRCFRSQSSGFYIDVGAWEPVLHSVTHHFYELGWHGVNIEPVPEYFEMLVNARSRDVNLRCAVSDEGGDLPFSFVEGSGLSTPRSLAERHVNDLAVGGFPTRVGAVPAVTLADVCQAYVAVGQDVDFLKVDVEGWEAKVLSGADWERWRPRVVVVEVVTPIGYDPRQTCRGRRPLDPMGSAPPANGYLFAAADGLNRWFVRSEDEALLEHFRFPVNALTTSCPIHSRVGSAATHRREREGA